MKKSLRRIYIDEKLYRNLPENLKSKVNSYRGVLGNLVKEENKIKKYRDEIKQTRLKYQKKLKELREKNYELIEECKDKIEDYHEVLTDKNIDIDNLRNDFEFSVSIVRTNPKGFEYYNVVISRRTKTPKNIYLGSDKKIERHLLEYYRNDETRLNKIKKDWLAELSYDLKVGSKYDLIFDMMFKLDYNFETTTINLDTLYPLNDDKVIK